MSRLAAVTGGTGFLGGHVVAALTAGGWRVRLLVRGAGRRAAPDSAGTGQDTVHGTAHDTPHETVRGALSDRAALDALVDGADAVVHLAGLVRARRRAAFMAANRDGTAAVVAAWRAAVPDGTPRGRFVHLSSMAAREPAISDYAASKAAGEAELHGPGEVVVLRPCAVYGPGDRATLGLFRAAAWAVQPVLNGPEARVALIHAADVAEAVLAAAEGRLPCGTWELTDARPQGYSWAEIAAAVAHAGGRPAARPVRVPAPALRLAGVGGDLAALAGAAPMLGSGKAREILHRDWGSRPEAQPPAAAWRPARDIESGFAETMAWYQRAGWLSRGGRARLRLAA